MRAQVEAERIALDDKRLKAAPEGEIERDKGKVKNCDIYFSACVISTNGECSNDHMCARVCAIIIMKYIRTTVLV